MDLESKSSIMIELTAALKNNLESHKGRKTPGSCSTSNQQSGITPPYLDVRARQSNMASKPEGLLLVRPTGVIAKQRQTTTPISVVMISLIVGEGGMTLPVAFNDVLRGIIGKAGLEKVRNHAQAA